MEKKAEYIKDLLEKIKNFFKKPIDEVEQSELDEAVERQEEVIDETVKLEEQKEKDEPVLETPIENEVLIHDIDVEEGEVEVHQYRADVPEDLQARLGDPAVDHSYTALMYLYSLGYNRIDFMLNPAEDREYDICDELAKENPWDLEGIVSNAIEDSAVKGYPVAPLFWLSHPGCLCYLLVYAPDTPDDIPDTAPGLHMWADEERLLAEKEELFNTLPTIVEVDSLTMAPEVFEQVKGSLAEDTSRTKKGQGGWVEEIKPVQIKEDIYIKQPMGLVQIVNRGAKGFQLEIYNEIAKVFLYEFGRELYIPIDSYSTLSLSLSNKTDPDEGDFIVADEEDLAIAYGMMDDELLVYDPEYNNAVRIDEWRVLEIV
jgi:hypothetical protein